MMVNKDLKIGIKWNLTALVLIVWVQHKRLFFPTLSQTCRANCQFLGSVFLPVIPFAVLISSQIKTANGSHFIPLRCTGD